MMNIAITLGDAAGIGPEVAIKAISAWARPRNVRILMLGPARFFNDLAPRLGVRNLRFRDTSLHSWELSDVSLHSGGVIPCYFPEEFPSKLRRGRSDRRWTKLAVRSIESAVDLAMKGRIDAVVTPPINKTGLKKAGFDIPGHTEYLAKLSGAKKFEMMLVGGRLRVVLVTRHLPLAKVPAAVTKRRVEEAVLLADSELRRSFGIRRPRIVVCGLNPHAGEAGHLGGEEIRVIAPAVRSVRKKIVSEIVGPLAPDALFHDAYLGRYDAEICMYHDQGLIPLKMISRGAGVNVTLGLPFVRTSPDHGTGYDIAPRFRADPGSFLESIKLAARLCENRRKYDRSRARR
jgi:4-hydroxythreonine-4-phosphate dehydrogenase